MEDDSALYAYLRGRWEQEWPVIRPEIFEALRPKQAQGPRVLIITNPHRSPGIIGFVTDERQVLTSRALTGSVILCHI